MAPAMAAGNTFVLKSSEKSPLALAAYGDLINEVSTSNLQHKTNLQLNSPQH
jgi:acyl-CoA reductase-like NAD-dependent aldehyde dehydrogenase